LLINDAAIPTLCLNPFESCSIFFDLSSFNPVLIIKLLIISFLLARKKPEFEKSTPYECGFDPFTDARGFFNVQFYTLGVLFILFDLELAFLYP
jgi:NADH:ubiquinone oxidoreductase subunit 3 (subunit A)